MSLPADSIPVAIGNLYETGTGDSSATVNGLVAFEDRAGKRWIVASTADDRLTAFDAASGRIARRGASSGTGMGELRSPAGLVALVDSVILVAERDNGRVQGFHVPGFSTIGTFGDRLFNRPVAVAAHPETNAYSVYVLDESPSGAGRVFQFRLTVGNGELIAIHWRTFGDTSGRGAINRPLSIGVDEANDRVLITDSDSSGGRVVVYRTDGRFSGETFSIGRGRAGHLTLVKCDSGGYWIVGRESADGVTFELFGRKRLDRIGVMADTAGAVTTLIASLPWTSAPRDSGAFFAAVPDGSVAAYSTNEIARAFPGSSACAR
jgi:3-phytase